MTSAAMKVTHLFILGLSLAVAPLQAAPYRGVADKADPNDIVYYMDRVDHDEKVRVVRELQGDGPSTIPDCIWRFTVPIAAVLIILEFLILGVVCYVRKRIPAGYQPVPTCGDEYPFGSHTSTGTTCTAVETDGPGTIPVPHGANIVQRTRSARHGERSVHHEESSVHHEESTLQHGTGDVQDGEKSVRHEERSVQTDGRSVQCEETPDELDEHPMATEPTSAIEDLVELTAKCADKLVSEMADRDTDSSALLLTDYTVDSLAVDTPLASNVVDGNRVACEAGRDRTHRQAGATAESEAGRDRTQSRDPIDVSKIDLTQRVAVRDITPKEAGRELTPGLELITSETVHDLTPSEVVHELMPSEDVHDLTPSNKGRDMTLREVSPKNEPECGSAQRKKKQDVITEMTGPDELKATPRKRIRVQMPRGIDDAKTLTYFNQFCEYVSSQMDDHLVPKPMEAKSKRHVLLPCIVASRLGTDVSATFTKANLAEGVRPILLLFHSRAHHNTKVYPTRKLGSDFLERTQFVVDLVIWEGELYDCTQNYNETCELLDYLDRH